MAKKKSFDIIPREGRSETGVDAQPELYRLMDDLIAEHHPDLEDANIVLAWKYSWKPNQDGHLVLGKFQVASAIDRALHGYDARILLNHEVWESVEFTPIQKKALLDHELCHGAKKYGSDMEPTYDPHTQRPNYRVRKHDVEEFNCIGRRYGCWKGDIEAFALAAMEGARANGQGQLFEEDSESPASNVIEMRRPA